MDKVLAPDKRIEQMCDYAEGNTDNSLIARVTESEKRRHTYVHTHLCTFKFSPQKGQI